MATITGAELKAACIARMNADGLTDATDYDFEIRRMSVVVRVSVPDSTPQAYVDVPLCTQDAATLGGLSAAGITALETWAQNHVSTCGDAL